VNGEATSESPPLRFLFSAAWQGNIEVIELPDPGITVHQQHRTIDWNLKNAKRFWVYLRDSLSIIRVGRSYDGIVISSAGLETFLVPLIWRFLPRRVRGPGALVVLDPIALRWRQLDRLFAFGMRSVDLVLCIRTGDVDMFDRRFGVPDERCRFLAMPVPDVDQAAPVASPRPPYVYAAGSAHRDWRLLLRAFELIPDQHCIVATQSLDSKSTPIPPNVELLPAQTIADGRVLMQHSTLVAVTFEDTDLACGPTIILDAYAMGIPVVSSDTNGSRDYVQHGVTGLLSPPEDPATLAANIAELLHSADRRTAMRRAIENLSRGELSRTVFEERLGQHLRAAVSDARRRPR